MVVSSQTAVRGAGLCALALALAACSDDVPPTPSGEPSPSATQDTTSAGEVDSRTVEVRYRTSDLSVDVGPVVLDGEHAVVRVRTELVDGPDIQAVDLYPPRTQNETFGPGDPIRLLDLDEGIVHAATTRSSGMSQAVTAAEPSTWYAQFDAGELMSGDETTVMLTNVGFVEDVPVLEAGEDGAFDVAEAGLQPPAQDWAQPLVASLDAYTFSWLEGTEVEVREDVVEANIASDVLFAVDSADLSPTADQSLQDVIAHLDRYPGGTLTIVGHTDDVADDAYNQSLSERRAEAVRARLESLTDLSRFTVSSLGRGESEPRAEGTSPEARQANRRVELLVEPTGETSDELVGTDTPMPPPTGVTGTGPEGVTVEYGDGTAMRVALDEVVREGGFLRGELVGTVETGPQNTNVRFGFSGQRSIGGPGYGGRAPEGLTLMWEGQRVAPAQYGFPGVTGRQSLTDLIYFDVPLETGEQRVVSVVWPDTGQDTVTLAYEYFFVPSTPFRLTDIPVVEAE